VAHDWLSDARIESSSTVRSLVPNAIFAGCEPPTCQPGLNAPAGGHALVLTHKTPSVGKPRARSASRFVAESPDLPAWKDALWPGGLDPDAPFAGNTIVVEDASPDTCLALVVLALRLRGELVPASWIDYADRWERGDTTSIGAPEQSWGALHQALVHPLLGGPDVALALTTGCRFVGALLLGGVDPQSVPEGESLDPDTDGHLRRARSHLRAERDLADRIGDVGEVLQLALEITESKRRRLVDAVVLTEEQLTSSLKSFLRRDPKSPSGAGYAFLALHRPLGKGTGNDMTFSVDPHAGVWLRDAWEALELAEWRAWGTARPVDAPRRLASYGRADLPSGIAACNQPWYDGAPLYTVLGAPRALDSHRTLGSKLSWSEALNTLWSVSAPIRFFDLRARGAGDGAPAVDVVHGGAAAAPFREPLAGLDDVFLCDLVVGPKADPTLLMWSETTARTIAAFLRSGAAPVEQLPRGEELDVVRGRGGAVVVSRHGAALVDIARDPAFPAAEIVAEVRNSAALLAVAKRLEARIGQARDRVVEAIASGSGVRKTRALGAIYSILREATKGAASLPTRSPDPLVAAVEEKLEARWNAESRFRAVLTEARELREMIATASDLRTDDLLHAVAIYGFPFALLVNLFAFAFGDAGSVLKSWTVFGVHLAALAAWLAGGFLLALVLMLWVRRRNRVFLSEVDETRSARRRGGDGRSR
jgi:hypothetical protein